MNKLLSTNLPFWGISLEFKSCSFTFFEGSLSLCTAVHEIYGMKIFFQYGIHQQKFFVLNFFVLFVINAAIFNFLINKRLFWPLNLVEQSLKHKYVKFQTYATCLTTITTSGKLNKFFRTFGQKHRKSLKSISQNLCFWRWGNQFHQEGLYMSS